MEERRWEVWVEGVGRGEIEMMTRLYRKCMRGLLRLSEHHSWEHEREYGKQHPYIPG